MKPYSSLTHVSRFLLARLHTDSLLDKRTPKDVKLTLARFLKGSTALEGRGRLRVGSKVTA